MNRKHETRVTGFIPEVLELFQMFDWPGNIRELRNVLERAVILTAQGEIPVKHLPQHIQALRPMGMAVAAVVGSAAPSPAIESSVEPGTEPMVGDGFTDPAITDFEAIRVPIGTTVGAAEKDLILRTLEHTRNNKTRAAEILDISLKTLHNKLKEYGAKDA